MNEVTLIFPHQLFQQHPALAKSRPVYLLEEWLFFRQYNFHQQKLLLHRASMKYYENWLEQQGYKVHYIESCVAENDCRQLVKTLSTQNITTIHIADPADNWLLKRMRQSCDKNDVQLHIDTTPNFLNSAAGVASFFNKKTNYFQTDFYTWQRKQRNILMDETGKPIGGKWTFDAENRQKFPKKTKAPLLKLPAENIYLKEARQYVAQHFSQNYGSQPLFVCYWF